MNKFKLIVGLGNPDKKYEQTRHNAGFMVIESMVNKLNLDLAAKNKNYKSWLWRHDDISTLLVEPLTYMNNSGATVAELVHFYKLHLSEILVINDDLDLPLGTIRLRVGSSSGGHNGVESINTVLSSAEYARIRVGIGRPPQNIPAESFVLQEFNDDEVEMVGKVVDQVGQIVLQLCSGEDAFTDKTINVADSF
jgi:PTH1 family peptidyl-tRNA hydrolase